MPGTLPDTTGTEISKTPQGPYRPGSWEATRVAELTERTV